MNGQPFLHRTPSLVRVLLAVLLLGTLTQWSVQSTSASTQIDIIGPAGSVSFGASVAILPNGNLVVTDPNFDGGIGVDIGAVYLYNGATGALISTLTGSQAGDDVGLYGVIVLSNGNYLVVSSSWDNGGVTDAGAVTWCSAVSGCNGAVSSSNSLVGSQAGDVIGYSGVIKLSNGSYVVMSPAWDNGGAADAGAVTWCSGVSGCIGAVSISNSLVGGQAGDEVGYFPDGVFPFRGVIELSNGNYIVRSPMWDNGGAADAGAVTWCSGVSGCNGAVSISNSLVGSHAGDQIGLGYSFYQGVIELTNGNYVVSSPWWDNGVVADAGAVTWGNGTSGTTGAVSSANSLVGSSTDDQVGNVTVLANGNYIVGSPLWDNGGTSNSGAVTWGNGSGGTFGAVSPANSLVGSQANDYVGSDLILLNNGNYLVRSQSWDNGGATDAGAVTWGNGTSGITGVVTAANSLVGSHTGDQIGWGIGMLSNGNYVVCSPYWDDGGTADAGAATWGSGSSGVSGAVSAANSLVGSQAGDQVGFGVTALSNGNYLVKSDSWDNGGASDAGAVTWGSGSSGISGAVSVTNSLVGSHDNDSVDEQLTELSNGNYVVSCPAWDNGASLNAGAVTWGSGSSGVSSVISPANSLVGSQADDWVGVVTALNNGNYVVGSLFWNNGSAIDAGAVTWGNGVGGTSGAVSSSNSLVGSQTNDHVGYEVIPLSNGNYVVGNLYWDNGWEADAGAATWGNGAGGTTGAISSANSLVGSHAGDAVGYGIVELINGNYIVYSTLWDDGYTPNVGAVTWGNGSSGVSGEVSAANSLVGSHSGDGVGYVTILSNGNYVVSSTGWDKGWIADVGAVTWGNGASGITGVVSDANSLVGSQAEDRVGDYVEKLSSGDYLVRSPYWDHGLAADAGAITWGLATSTLYGSIDGNNSVMGWAGGGGSFMFSVHDGVNDQLVVSRPKDNTVTLFRLYIHSFHIYLPLIEKS
jgi:hypothetical protein